MMLLIKTGTPMAKHSFKLVKLKRPGLIVAAAVMLTSACAATPPHHVMLEEHLPVGEAEEIFAAGFSSIADKYLDEISVEAIALEGMRGLNALDPGIVVAQDDDTLEIRYQQRTIARLPAPEGDDAAGWASTVASMTAKAQSYSSDLASASPEKLYEAVFDGAMGALDVFSRYAGSSEANDNRAKRDGFGGIGIRFRLDKERIVVTEVMPATPAADAGLHIGDHVIAVQGQTLLGMGTKAVVKQLRGPVDSPVSLTIQRKDVGMIEITMNRSHIVPPTVKADIRENILYLKIASFNQGTASNLVSELRSALADDSAPNHDVKGIVLDLRGNPGGLLKQSIEVADAFLVHGDILNTLGRHPDSIQHYEATGQDQAQGLPMVVLIDGKSASAAEIVAAALQDRERAVVVGTASYGKGTVQTVIRLPNSGEITLTWSRFMAPSGYALHGLGVYPVICTSGTNDNASENLRMALDRHDKTLDTLTAWRSIPHTDEQTRSNLRTECPPERHTGKNDVEIARTLIEDGALYFRALDSTSSTALAIE